MTYNPNATGDMSKSVYDTDSDSIVDDSEKLGGSLPAAYELVANKGIANGYASLGAGTTVPLAQIPTPLTGKDADTVDGVNLPATIASVLTDHTKAVHDALAIDADTVDAKHASDLHQVNSTLSDQSALGFNTARQPNATRPVFAFGTVRISCDKGEIGRVNVKIENANPPTIERVNILLDYDDADAVNASRTIVGGTFCFICPAGWRYLLDDVIVNGAPTFLLDHLWELVL